MRVAQLLYMNKSMDVNEAQSPNVGLSDGVYRTTRCSWHAVHSPQHVKGAGIPPLSPDGSCPSKDVQRGLGTWHCC